MNLPGIASNQVKLTGEALAEIYLGKITKWNDPKLAALNAGVALPNLAIAPVYRADGSGTTFVFASYLSAVSAEWKDKVGAATSVKWPAGTGAKGNDGIAATVSNTRGAIGYVESAYATQNKLTTAQLRNRDGASSCSPTAAAFTAAAASRRLDRGPQNYAVNLDQPARSAQQLADRVHHLHPAAQAIPKDGARVHQRAEVLRLGVQERRRNWPRGLDYVPLPARRCRTRVRADLVAPTVMADGKPVYS